MQKSFMVLYSSNFPCKKSYSFKLLSAIRKSARGQKNAVTTAITTTVIYVARFVYLVFFFNSVLKDFFFVDFCFNL
jgi:hypothetical protein